MADGGDGCVVAWDEHQCREWLRSQVCLACDGGALRTLCDFRPLSGAWLMCLDADDLRQLGIGSSHIYNALLAAVRKLRDLQESSDLAAALCLQFGELQVFQEQQRSSQQQHGGAAPELSTSAQGGHVQPGSEALAVEAMRGELLLLQQTISDHNAARQFDADTAAAAHDHLAASRVQRELDTIAVQERNDHELACRTAGRRPVGGLPEALAPPGTPPLVTELLQVASSEGSFVQTAAAYFEDDGVEESKESDPPPQQQHGVLQTLGAFFRHVTGAHDDVTTAAAGRREKAASSLLHVRTKCYACLEDGKRCAQFACGHCSCAACLGRLFSSALRDTSLIPIRCCDLPVDPNLATLALSGQRLARYKQLEVEASVTRKMYCTSPTCSTFINLDAVTAAGEDSSAMPCPAGCGATVCTHCRKAGHSGSCAAAAQQMGGDGDGLTELAALGAQQGWQHCAKCGHLVELVQGCFHMTCQCRHEFCYVCSAQWKECGCPVWDEWRLTVQAEEDVRERERRLLQLGRARQAGDAAAEQRRLQGLVAQRRAQLLAHDDCMHGWARRQPALATNCQNCGYFLPVYCFECTAGCGYLVCYTCRYHRLGRQHW